MRTLIIAACAAAILATAGAAAAMPIEPASAPPPPAPTPTIVRVTPPPTSAIVAAVSSHGGGSGGSSPETTYPAGCRTIDFYAQQKSILFRSVIYRFHQIKHWCWRKGYVYDVRTAWSFDGSSTACLGTVYPPNSWFFTWWHDVASSGHFSEQRAHVTNCIFHVGDWKEFYPDVKIWSYADGTYQVTTDN